MQNRASSDIVTTENRLQRMAGINIHGTTVNTPREMATELARHIPGATAESLANRITAELGLSSPDAVIPPEMESRALKFASFVNATNAGREQVARGIQRLGSPSAGLRSGPQSAARRLREAGFSLPINEEFAAHIAKDSPETFALMLELAERTSGHLLADDATPVETLSALRDLAARIRGRDPYLKPLNRQKVLAAIDAANEWAPDGWSVRDLEFVAGWPGITDQVLTDLPRAMASLRPTRTPACLPFSWAEAPNRLNQLQTLAQRLGRGLTDVESFNVELALKSGVTVEQLALAPNPPADVSLKDHYVWRLVQGTDAETMTRDALLEELEKKVELGSTRSDDLAVESESLAHWGPKLSVWEFHKIRMLTQHLKQPDAQRAIGEIIARDLELDDTELGGMVRSTESGIRFEAMEPAEGQRASNENYILPEMNPWSGIASFHLHATRREGTPEGAGPSTLDLAAARKRHTDGVVITLVRPGLFNVDFYTASGAVVDLGDYQIPVSS